jgi:periplasmic divalent cation tolerance protein
MTPYLQVATTVENKIQAETMTRTLLERRLVACVQIVACNSMYHWQNNIESSGEYLCLMKTRADLFAPLKTAIEEMHPYEVPEILATPIVEGNTAYLSWLEQELGILQEKNDNKTQKKP